MLEEKIKKAQRLIQLFCQKPYRDHGKKMTEGAYTGWCSHDWGMLVQQLGRNFTGNLPSIEQATEIALLVRSEFPNNAQWNRRVGTPAAQKQILEIIAAGLEVKLVEEAEEPEAEEAVAEEAPEAAEDVAEVAAELESEVESEDEEQLSDEVEEETVQ